MTKPPGSPLSSSQEIHVDGGFVVPRRLGLATVGAIIVTLASMLAFGVRAEQRVTVLERDKPGLRLRRMERVLCAICVSNPATVGNPACADTCSAD